MRVGHGFKRGEGLRGDDEEGLLRIDAQYSLSEVSPVNVGDKPKCHVALAVMLQGLVRHDRAKVRSADADVDDVADAFAAVTLPGAAADEVAEVGHSVERGGDLRHHVLPLPHNRW